MIEWNETSRLLDRLGKKIEKLDGMGACGMTTDISATHESYMMMADMFNADAEELLGTILFFLRDETDFEFYVDGKLEQTKNIGMCVVPMQNEKYVGGCTIVVYHDAYHKNGFVRFDLNTKNAKSN